MMRFGRALGSMDIQVKQLTSATGIPYKELNKKIRESKKVK